MLIIPNEPSRDTIRRMIEKSGLDKTKAELLASFVYNMGFCDGCLAQLEKQTLGDLDK